MKKIIYLIIGLLICTPAYAQVRVFTPSQGGTGISSATAGDIGYCLKVLSATPFAYELGSCGTGGGGSGGGSWSTTTSSVTGRLINYPNNTTDIVVIGGTATTTGATEYWFDPNTQNAHIGSSNTASTSVMGLFLLPTVGQGFLYGGTGGNVNAIASSSVRLSWFNNDAGFATFPFTVNSWGNSTTSTLGLLNGFLSTASSTISITGNAPALSINSSQTTSQAFGAIELTNNSSSGIGLHITHTDANNSQGGVRLDSPSPEIEFVETDQATPAGKFETRVNNDAFHINGRTSADDAFEEILTVKRVASGGSVGLLDQSPDARLEVVATSTDRQRMFALTSSSGTDGLLFNSWSDGYTSIGWENPSVAKLQLNSNAVSPSSIDLTNTIAVGTGASGANATSKFLGQFGFLSRDSSFTAPKLVAYIGAEATESYAADVDVGSDMVFYTGTQNNTNPTEKFRIKDSGNLQFAYSSSTGYSSFVTASSTNWLGGGLQTCDPITGKLTWSGGQFGCVTDQTGGGGSGSGTISTTTPLVSGQVAFSTGVSTIGNDSNFTFDSATDKLTVSLASTTGFSTSYASSTLGYIGSLFLPSVSQGYSYIGSNGLLNTISTSTLFSQINLFDLDTNTPFGTPLNSVYRIRSSFNNFLSNSSFESWLSGTSVAPSGWTLAGDATVSRSSTATINSYSAQVVFGTANTGELYQVIDTSTLVDYTFSAYVQRTSGTGNARLVAQRADAPFTEFVSVPLSTGGGWQLITLTVKPSAGTQTRFAIKSSDAVASTWLIDEAMFQEGKNLASTWLPAYIDDTNNQQVYGSKTFNALQTFNYSSSTIYSSFLTASSTFLNAGSITLATTTAGTVKTTSSGLFYVDTSAGGGGGVTSVTATYPIISSGGTTPAISIAFSTTTANIWSALNTFNGGLTIGTTTAGILRTNASGVVYASTATTTMSLFNDFTIPDSSGDVWLAPNSINSANSVSDQMVFVASSSVAKVGIHGSILIPSNFSSSSAKVRFAWTATSTSNAVVNDFDYRCVSGNNTTSLYQTSWQENKTVTTNNPSTAGYRITSTMDINAGYYCSAGDTMQFFLTRDGTDGSDTSTVDQEIFSASIDLLTQ